MTQTATVTAMRLEAKNVLSLELLPESGSADPYEPGSHIDLVLGNGLTRSYSIYEPYRPGQPYRVAVARDLKSRGGSVWIHDQLRVGDSIEVSAPRNNFRLDLEAPSHVLIAGGIGITPLWCMVQTLVEDGRRPTLFYSARDRASAAFLGDIGALGDRVDLQVHFDDEAGGPPDLNKLLSDGDPQTAYLCCGPAPMLDAFVNATEANGLPNATIERFAALEQDASDDALDEFEVVLARSGTSVTVRKGESILDTLRDTGMDLPHSCKEGVCGSCEVGVIDGVIDHRDSVLTKDEREDGDTMMICVSGSKSKQLVLDL